MTFAECREDERHCIETVKIIVQRRYSNGTILEDRCILDDMELDSALMIGSAVKRVRKACQQRAEECMGKEEA